MFYYMRRRNDTFLKRRTQLKAFSQRLKNTQDNCKMIIKSQIIKASCKVLSGIGRVGGEGGQSVSSPAGGGP